MRASCGHGVSGQVFVSFWRSGLAWQALQLRGRRPWKCGRGTALAPSWPLWRCWVVLSRIYFPQMAVASRLATFTSVLGNLFSITRQRVLRGQGAERSEKKKETKTNRKKHRDSPPLFSPLSAFLPLYDADGSPTGRCPFHAATLLHSLLFAHSHTLTQFRSRRQK